MNNTNLEILVELASSQIPKDVKKILSSKTSRREMLAKYGKQAFLNSKDLKFPVINPISGDFDCKLIYAAYVRAKQFKYNDIAAKAKFLFNKIRCGSKLNIQLENKELFSDLLKDSEIQNIMFELNTNFKIEESNNVQETIKNDNCICPLCKFEVGLSNDYSTCSLQPCPICETKMEEKITIDNVTNSLVDKFKETVEEVMNIDICAIEGKFICNECNTIVEYNTKVSLEGVCPKCQNEMGGQAGSNFEQTFHIHRCPICKWESKPFKNIEW